MSRALLLCWAWCALAASGCAARVRQVEADPTGATVTERRLAELDAQRRERDEAVREALRWERSAKSLASERAPRLLRCYAREASDEQGAEELIELEWHIAPDGRVRDVSVVWSNLASSEALQCMVEEARSWTFSAHHERERVTSYPFALRR